MRRFRPFLSFHLVLLATVLIVVLTPAEGRAAGIPHSEPTLEGNLAGAPGCHSGAPGPACRPLLDPGSPHDDPADALAGLRRPGTPEDDLAAALRAMRSAPDAAAAGKAADEARAILAGEPLEGRAYSGIPLLNWNVPARVRRVPAGGAVTVTVVRTPQHTLSDTWLLDFEDPDRPYTITYRVSELGGTMGGELRPTPLLTDANRGLHSALVSLVPPALETGTSLANRFTGARDLPDAGGAEHSRQAAQDVTVRMPPPGVTRAILEPGDRAAPLALAPATEERREAAADAYGFSSAEPTPEQRNAAIARLAPGAPERQLWDDLAALPPAADDGFLTAARALGDQNGALVDAMRSRAALPAGVARDASAAATVAWQNGEPYGARTPLRAAADGRLRLQLVNRDGFEREIEVLALHGRRPLGVDDWGGFAWKRLGTAKVDERDARTLSVDVPAGTFALWVGDPGGGGQAGTVLELENGPRRESVRMGADGSLPTHAAFAPDGDLWITLAGSDEIVRMSPSAQLGESRRATLRIPGGAHEPTSQATPQGPLDIAVDHRGIVWATLSDGNAIARIDPAQVADGTDRGIKTYPLPPCGKDECAPVLGAPADDPPTRAPLQLALSADGDGNVLVWFTESATNRIGLLRAAPDGRELGQSHFSCECTAPLGIALGAEGDVWFTEGVDNRIGKLTPDVTDVGSVDAATLRHFNIPSAVSVLDPELSPTEVRTSAPHSVAVDHRGLVWFTEEATGRVARLDPAAAVPGKTSGIEELELPRTAFGAAPHPADFAIDRKGTLFWADEYGDSVGVVETAGGPEAWRTRSPLRVSAPRSLTDSPVLDPAGNLFVVETGANVLTRISGAGAGEPLPSAPPRVELDLGADRVTVEGLQTSSAVDVSIERSGETAARATGLIPADGRLTVTGSRWGGAADALRPGDVVRLALPGDDAPLRVRAAGLDARRTPAGLEGRAVQGPSAIVAGVELIGAPGVRASVDARTGGFAVPAASFAGLEPRGVAVQLAWPSAVVRTVAPVAADEPDTGTPPGPGAEPPAQPAPAATPQPAAEPAPVSRPRARWCSARLWLTASARRFDIPLLGRSVREVRACLGRPMARSVRGGRERLRFGAGLELTAVRGRVTGLAVTRGPWSSAPGGLRVGAPGAAIGRALPAATRRGLDRRAVVRLAGGGRALVVVRVDRGRVARITVGA